ncbi:hypothetical protein GGI25_004435 [Coemansia spiralis]|uniref:Uncharacterized protein n=2 Tax=Coemansia TaxID=4863 RepID=A0A9W8G672_9FUNG|nr:hypothetical protein EDC05_001606 [Coemansia umbellata]KAJ2624285.1 hypothetical protein GGI26_001641 [Coemansia sp. RSA 1358]KAJ2674218.1 hypothetical protein GGI25_004435 [Coemansia spiralis]
MNVHSNDAEVHGSCTSANLAVLLVDVIASFNYAMCCFHKRSDLIKYLKHSISNLNNFSLLFCNPLGGLEIVNPGASHARNVGAFSYYFCQDNYDLLRNAIRFSLSFRMQDGSMLKDCFAYRLRAYSVCELKEAVLESRFDCASIWISKKNEVGSFRDTDYESSDDSNSETDANSGGNEFGPFTELVAPTEVPQSFNTYVVGVKLPESKQKRIFLFKR